MRLCRVGVILAVTTTILFAGGVNGELIRNTNLDEGTSFTFSVITASHVVRRCQLETPQDGIVDYEPGDVHKSTEKYHIELGTSISVCQVTVVNIDAKDEGVWTMAFTDKQGVSESQVHNVTVNFAEPQGNEEEEKHDEDETLLSEINHFTRQEMLIDITLNKESFEEECLVLPPNGNLIKADLLSMANVTVQSSSNYVSCRITIGPMSEDLLGEWRLCGKSSSSKKIRCQPATIAWNNNNAIANWDSLVQPRFSHPVNFGGSVNPGVAGRGNIITCHVITPNGEDLVMKSDVKYPHIDRIAYDSPSLCSFLFSNIDRAMIGDWTIYGKFRATVGGLNEVHLPLNFFLYNEANPYEQAYNVTVLEENTHLVRLGTTLILEVSGPGELDVCKFRMPSGQALDVYDIETADGVTFKSLENTTSCQIVFDSITEKMLGGWQIIGKYSNGNQFSEKRQIFQIVKEDPENPIVDEDRIVENMTELIVDTKMGASHRVVINSVGFVENESCHLVTPNGLQYAFIAGFKMPNVEIIESHGVECGVMINVLTLDMLGNWTLIARATRLSVPIERRLSFTIRVEETFSIGNPINITEGADLYIRLPNVTNLYETCKLYGPYEEEITDFEVDSIHIQSCGYIVRGVNYNQQGTWSIVYGNQITYRATIEVNVLVIEEIYVEDSLWIVGRTVNMTIGPEDAVYCRVENVKGITVFDGFGLCKIVVDRVTIDHRGIWKIFIGVPGTVLLQKYIFYVEVEEASPNPVVTTEVTRNAPSVLLTCAMPYEYKVQACKFRDPRGNILVASHGVGQDGYTFEGAVVNYESDAQSHNCTLRLINPSKLEMGLWRCAILTDQATYFGFLTVICPWLMQDETIAASVITEPVLKSERDVFPSLEGEAVVMSCSVDSAIKYCYFRARNGTVFNVAPTISSPGYRYFGNGLDAGDCGVRFDSLLATDSGSWSCHVGLDNLTAGEQRASFTVQVKEKMSVDHFWNGTSVVVKGTLYNWIPVDYCRFVRIDGMGFTSDNVPPEYHLEPMLHVGICSIRIWDPTILDVHPWTVVVKVPGLVGEISKSTTDTLLIFPMIGGMPLSYALWLWSCLIILMVIVIAGSVALIPKKNREWTYARASHVRNSFRSSFKKIPMTNKETDVKRNV